MFSGTGVIIGFVVLALLVVAVVGFIIRSAIQEVEKQRSSEPIEPNEPH